MSEEYILFKKISNEFSRNFAFFEVTRVANGFTNTNWIVRSNDEIFILKKFNKTFTEERINFIINCQSYLFESLKCSPKVYFSNGNKPYACVSGNYYTITEFIKGSIKTPSELTANTYSIIGAFLGRIHRQLGLFSKYEGDDNFLKYPENALGKIEKLIKYHEIYTRNEFCITSLKLKYELLNSFDNRLVKEFLKLPRQIIHGDFYLGNLIFKDNIDIPFLIDFDQASMFSRVYEVMRGFIFSVNFTENIEVIKEKMKVFLLSYLSENKLSIQEMLLMVDLYYWILLSDTFCFEPSTNRVKVNDFSKLLNFGKYRMCIIGLLRNEKSQFKKMIQRVFVNGGKVP